MAEADVRTGRAFDRMINFSDAVVAIAITLLVLPLVNIPGPTGSETVWNVIGANAAQVIAFVVTFLVVAMMWTVHNRVVNTLIGYDTTMLWLNNFWILGIAFLPWPASMYGQSNSGSTSGEVAASGEGFSGTGVLYWGTMAMISLLSWLMGLHIARHPYLIEPSRRARWAVWNTSRGRLRGPAFVGAFALLGVASVFIPAYEAWLPFVLVPLGILLRDPQDVDVNRVDTQTGEVTEDHDDPR